MLQTYEMTLHGFIQHSAHYDNGASPTSNRQIVMIVPVTA
jgi:hypothetical protein